MLKDLTLPTTYDGTTQIDHIVVSRFGVFVIETKNMTGKISGGDRQEEMDTAVLFLRKETQNSKIRAIRTTRHVKTVQELLGVPEDEIHNVVVFVGSAKLEIWPQRPANVVVRIGRGLIDYIKSEEAGGA